MATHNRQELIDAFRVRDDAGQVYTVEVWAMVTYSGDNFDPARRTVGTYAFYLRDGTRLIRNSDHAFTNISTGQILHHLESWS
jgi:hypothetical protein